ncbi:hypothetical protein L1887_32122 [Cichorium endivia]|nr:hypothetical protein L1887_32122 [Cichorium endivia]
MLSTSESSDFEVFCTFYSLRALWPQDFGVEHFITNILNKKLALSWSHVVMLFDGRDVNQYLALSFRATSHRTPMSRSAMQPIAPSVVQNTRVEQDYRKSDDHCIPADLVVVGVAVLFSEVPDLGSMIAVVLVEPILHLHHHASPQPLDTGTAAEEVVAGIVAVVV